MNKNTIGSPEGQGEGSDCPPLLCPSEAPSGGLCPGLGFLAQERCRDFGAGAENSCEDDQRVEVHLL